MRPSDTYTLQPDGLGAAFLGHLTARVGRDPLAMDVAVAVPPRRVRRNMPAAARRAALAAGLVATLLGAANMASSGTFARSSATSPSATKTVTAGTVTLSNSPTTACSVTGIYPDGSAHACPAFTATYNGTVPAYLAADVLIETQAATGGSNLYNPADGANDLQVSVTSTTPTVTYITPATATTCPTGTAAGITCYELDDELISTAASSSASIAFTASATLPTTAVAGTQGGSATILITVHTVQSRNNTLSCTTTPAAGSACHPNSPFKWN